MIHVVLTRFSCGHVGTELGIKLKTFVRVAEIRRNPVEDDDRPCPDCIQTVAK
jgi:hypothetical protein